MDKRMSAQPLGKMAVSEFKELMGEEIAGAEAYADYLDKQEGKLPSEVNAYFFDEQGWRCFYSDWEPTPEKARELDEARRQIAEGKVHLPYFRDVKNRVIHVEDIDKHDEVYRR